VTPNDPWWDEREWFFGWSETWPFRRYTNWGLTATNFPAAWEAFGAKIRSWVQYRIYILCFLE